MIREAMYMEGWPTVFRVTGFEDGEMGHETRNRQGHGFSPMAFRNKYSPASVLVLAQ